MTRLAANLLRGPGGTLGKTYSMTQWHLFTEMITIFRIALGITVITVILISISNIISIRSYCFQFDWAKSINFKRVIRVPMHVLQHHAKTPACHPVSVTDVADTGGAATFTTDMAVSISGDMQHYLDYVRAHVSAHRITHHTRTLCTVTNLPFANFYRATSMQGDLDHERNVRPFVKRAKCEKKRNVCKTFTRYILPSSSLTRTMVDSGRPLLNEILEQTDLIDIRSKHLSHNT